MLLSAADQDMQQAESRQQQDTEQDQGPASTEKQWWHGTFVKAGRMGNMAAEVLQHGPDKEVRYKLSNIKIHCVLALLSSNWNPFMYYILAHCFTM